MTPMVQFSVLDVINIIIIASYCCAFLFLEKQNFKEMFSISIDFNSDVIITNDTREPE